MTYEELVEQCWNEARYKFTSDSVEAVRIVLAVARRELETVTDEMWTAGATLRESPLPDETWLAMLHACPLVPPK